MISADPNQVFFVPKLNQIIGEMAAEARDQCLKQCFNIFNHLNTGYLDVGAFYSQKTSIFSDTL